MTKSWETILFIGWIAEFYTSCPVVQLSELLLQINSKVTNFSNIKHYDIIVCLNLFFVVAKKLRTVKDIIFLQFNEFSLLI